MAENLRLDLEILPFVASSSGFIVMDKLEELYSIAFSCNCFEEAYKREIYNALGELSCSWENDDIDSILLALTVVQKLYQRLETLRCTYLKIITDGLVSKNQLVDILLKYLDHTNQHVVFSASKAFVLVFQTLPREAIKAEWFQTLFNFGTGQPWRKLYAMEVLSKILKKSRETLKNNYENSQQQIINQIRSCSHESGSSCLISTTVSRTELVDMLLGSLNLQHILFFYLPFIVRPNGMYSFLRSSQQVGPAEDFVVLQASLKLGDAIHSQENVKREAISGVKENNLVVFLHCISELGKYLEVNRTLQNKNKLTPDIRSCNEEENCLLRSQDSGSKDSFRRKTVQPYEGRNDSTCVTKMAITHVKDDTVNQLCSVMATLIQYLHYPRLPSLIFKKILEVLNQVVVTPDSFIFRQKTKCTELEKIVRSSSISFLSVVQCCLFHKIPRCSGFVGFSGTEIKSSSETKNNNGRSADLVALRKASLMVFKSSFVVLKLAKKHEGSLLFQNLSLSCVSKWCSEILSLAPDACLNDQSRKESSHESEFHNCLVTLFVDQDDDLVEVMLLLLLLFQEIQQTVPGCGEISTTLLCQLNPHLLFISFAESVEFDHSFLLDLLISSETRFLEYLVQYLHFVIAGWNSFVQCLVEYETIISCAVEEALIDDVAMCSVHPRELEVDSNSSEKPSEFESCFANEMRSSKNDVLFTRQETLAGEDKQYPEFPRTFPWPQNNSCVKCTDSHFWGIRSGDPNGLTSIVLAYSSSDESEVENEDEDKSANDHKKPAVSQSDSIICSNVCRLSNYQRGSSSNDKADSTEMSHSTFTAKSCPGLLQNVSETPRKHTSNLNNSEFSEHVGFSSNQPDGESNVIDCLGDQRSSSSTKPLHSSDRNREIVTTKESRVEGSVTNQTAVECELLDKIMTMLIRLRFSVTRLSCGGHFPYYSAPLISLMENMEKCYDGC